MPLIRVRKQKKKSLARKLKHAVRGGNKARPFSFYLYMLLAFILALLVGMYLINKANRIEPEQPVQTSQQSPRSTLRPMA
ncbi:MAG: hypothetical protein Q8K68_07700 [Nitrospirota bacterium]|nr:hypothetical protein [Nitrospirota bacterium]